MFPSDGGSGAGAIPSIPGDPGTLSGAASRLGAAASAVRDWGSQLGSATSGLSGTAWSGQGAVSFASCVSSLEANHNSAAGALADASSALSAFASVLAECQASVRSAQSQVAQAQSSATSALSLLNAQPVPAHDPAAASQRAYSETAVQNSLQQEVGVAVARAQTAWDQYEAAAARAAAQIGNSLPGWSSVAEKIGWLNDKAGFGLVPVGVGFLAPLARAGARWIGTDRVIEGALAQWRAENLGPWEEAFEAGDVSAVEFAARVSQYGEYEQIARALFSRGAVQDIAAGGITPDLRFATPLTAASRFMAGAAVVSDMATIIKPDDGGAAGWVDRGMAGANGVASADAVFSGAGSEAIGGVLGIVDVSSSWIPVAGQVVLAGTALYLAGDWAYNNVKWFHTGVDDIGHGIVHAGEGLVHDGAGLVHGAEDVAHFFGL
jgi:uncharacterized protein YukE